MLRNNKERIFKIGCSGFYNRQWKGVFYPEHLPQSQWLSYYCEHLNSIEINATFYHFPTLKGLHNWYIKSPEGFVFSLKAPKLITHMKKFIDCKSLLDDFYSTCSEGLKEKLGCVLFQLPPSIQYSEEKLELILKNLNPNFKNVVEFRHNSWWTKEVFDELGKHDITFCSVSHPNLPDILVANTTTIYKRLHGKPKLFYSEYTSEEIDKLYNSIIEKPKIKEAFVYFNNTASTAGITNALQLVAKNRRNKLMFYSPII